ncbi:four-carbon acid sugar kinase family protein [Primorskyibacter aestuariivivens]|uniref:3-oxo-tetronate kinase n=1 Tax=Primorskyibacter aestuariivivens TaxID=1888912 RepID=UPI002301DA05|nr:3-oxo-tetronate kinase [Primorskyibacter aestuariivivens]MDA7429565.1 four-carbon acid sugar kinase family protein [Primorskyibacter aestuariivivens]
MTTVLGCIADDFTGATDLAGLLARSGVKVSLRMGVPDSAPSDTAPFEVIALKIRTVPADQAVEQALKALDWLKAAGAERFFWKYCSTFDSTPQGNIGPVAEALMAALGTDQTIYCPAFPENGRAIFMGTLFVGQTPLAESPMKDHPLTPMRDSNLMRLLQPQVTRPVGLADRLTVAKGPDALRAELDRLAAEGTAHVVVDAVADADLTTIAAACRDMPLMTGGSAVAMPLPALFAADGLLAADAPGLETPKLGKGAVILSGSCSAMTNKQVATYKATGRPAFQLDPLSLANDGHAAAVDWLAAQDLSKAPLIYATAEPTSVRAAQDKLGVQRAGEIVEQALAACAIAARDAGAQRFVVAGGETSGAVTQALGVDRLDIGAEIAPGVPWCFATSDGTPIALTLKSGNFGAERFFTDALDKLEGA